MKRWLLASFLLFACSSGDVLEGARPASGSTCFDGVREHPGGCPATSDGGADPSQSESGSVRCNVGDFHACTGPAGCLGRQACVADGSGYAPCDCTGGVSGVGESGGAGGTGGAGGAGPVAEGGAGGVPLASGGSTNGMSSGTQIDAGVAGQAGVPAAAPFPASVGTPCTSDTECAGPETCLKATDNSAFASADNPAGGGPQGGYCSLPCQIDADCTAIDDISACNTSLGICFALCVPGNSPVKCGADRAQACFSIRGDNSLGACLPRCTSDAACGASRFCDPSLLGLCQDAQPQGGKVGAPCDPLTETTDCQGQLCLQYADPNNPSATVGSFCSANCTFGLANGCGFDDVSGGVRQAGCFQPQLAGGQPGDIGFCFPVCDGDADCAQVGAGWVCDPFNDPVAEAQVGRLGECLPVQLAKPRGDAGPG